MLVLRSSWKVTVRYGSDIFLGGEDGNLVGLGFGCALEIMSTKVCMLYAGILFFYDLLLAGV